MTAPTVDEDLKPPSACTMAAPNETVKPKSFDEPKPTSKDLTVPSSPTGSGYKTAGSAVGSVTPPNNHPASVEATWNNPYSAASYSSGYAPMPTLYYHSQYCPHYGGWDIHGTPVTCMQYPSIYPHPVYAPYGYFTAPIPAYVVTPPMPPTPQSQLGASQLSTSFHSVESSGNGGSQNGTRGGKKGRIPCGQCHEERIKYSGEVRAFKGRIVETIKNQNGSRYIQQKLATADEEEVQLIFEESMKDFEDLQDDVYGNYILQKLLQFGTDEMREKIFCKLSSDVIAISARPFGCRVLQSSFETLPKQKVAALAVKFKGNVLSCVHDHNSNHVIQKAITVLGNCAKEARDEGDEELCEIFVKALDPIINEINRSISSIARHSYGCRCVQRILESCVDPHRSKTLDGIVACHGRLMEDQYGNYPVQKSIVHGRECDRGAIFRSLTKDNDIIRFSKHKQVSHIVEACLRHGTSDQREQIIEKMLSGTGTDHSSHDESGIINMCKNPYGNYVLKTVLDLLDDGNLRDRVFQELIAHKNELVSAPYCKDIIEQLDIYQT